MALLSTADAKGTNSGGTVTLTSVQKDEVFFLYQEEKVARDVYITLGKLYPGENTFASIQLSEQRHMDSVKGLCDTYGVDTSEVDESVVGEFVLPVLQDLYDTCVSMGSESLLDGLKVGKLIEETDIKDITHIIEDFGMPADVITVCENLREGSYNHLDAFNTAIAAQ